MQAHDTEFSSFRGISVKVITWNAGSAKPSDLDYNPTDSAFLHNALKMPDVKEDPDIVVFGFQELVELDNKSVTAKSMFSKRKKEKEPKIVTNSHISPQYKAWQDKLIHGLAAEFRQHYRLIQSNNMVGLFTCVFVKESEFSNIRGVRSSMVKTGLGGLHGNKGGLVVRFILDDSSFCFVNSHLAAGQSSAPQRNKDIETILETQFLDPSENTKYVGKGVFANGGDGTMILDHEFCFFSGDMNYRLNMHRKLAIRGIEHKNYDRLLEFDQLLIQLVRSPGHRLRPFQESTINFAPTYKFDVGTDNYDSSEKRRVPAWCDRIFYRGGDRITPLVYDSVTVRVSDHRPVVGIYETMVKTIDPSLRQEAYKDCLDRWQLHLGQVVSEARKIADSQAPQLY